LFGKLSDQKECFPFSPNLHREKTQWQRIGSYNENGNIARLFGAKI
jgi:hypothetical protein